MQTEETLTPKLGLKLSTTTLGESDLSRGSKLVSTYKMQSPELLQIDEVMLIWTYSAEKDLCRSKSGCVEFNRASLSILIYSKPRNILTDYFIIP